MRPRTSGPTALLLGLALLLTGCEEDVVAVLGTEHPFSLWGVLSPIADTQFVRVFPIEGTLNRGRPEPLDARFTSRDLDTGEEHVWRDSVLVNEQGVVGHVFYAPFRAVHTHTYRLEITAADGRSSTVEVTVPPRTALTLAEPDTLQGVLLPVYVLNDPPRLVRSELTVGAGYVTGFTDGGCPLYEIPVFVLPFDDRARRTDDGWWFLVNLGEVYRFVEERVLEDPDFVRPLGITLASLRFDTIVANEAWNPPGGVFDLDVLAQPGTMSNVENGFGFVGAGYRLRRTWTLPVRVIERSGFRADYQPCV
ncbi:hypothetical protein AWN76_008180 [Rhodothermaceae bacterium RA]|nr:hypothetical protein AWN76_008180 [Rhodothermaceae bacterium RA]